MKPNMMSCITGIRTTTRKVPGSRRMWRNSFRNTGTNEDHIGSAPARGAPGVLGEGDEDVLQRGRDLAHVRAREPGAVELALHLLVGDVAPDQGVDRLREDGGARAPGPAPQPQER